MAYPGARALAVLARPGSIFAHRCVQQVTPGRITVTRPWNQLDAICRTLMLAKSCHGVAQWYNSSFIKPTEAHPRRGSDPAQRQEVACISLGARTPQPLLKMGTTASYCLRGPSPCSDTYAGRIQSTEPFNATDKVLLFDAGQGSLREPGRPEGDCKVRWLGRYEPQSTSGPDMTTTNQQIKKLGVANCLRTGPHRFHAVNWEDTIS